MSQSATIKLFLVNGEPDGLRTAEISNWSGKAIAGPRSDLKSLRARDELKSAGVYFLVGEDPESEEVKLYIGEAEDVSHRLASKRHAERDFWVSAIAFVSKDAALTKAHIKYIEGRFIKLALDLQVNVENSQESGAHLPESEQADMNYFFRKMLQLLPILGVRSFEAPRQRPEEDDDWLFCKIKGLVAKGRRTANGFLVAAGSQAVPKSRPSGKRAEIRRQRLIEKGVLEAAEDHMVFIKNYEFGSPSVAGTVIRGGSTNGLNAWRDKTGRKLREIESA